jgi:hypothetical protein
VVARWAHNPKVAGSSPVPATKNKNAAFSGFFYAGKILKHGFGILFYEFLRQKNAGCATAAFLFFVKPPF